MVLAPRSCAAVLERPATRRAARRSRPAIDADAPARSDTVARVLATRGRTLGA